MFEANYQVYGARKMWKAARRAGYDIGRDQIARLMRELGIEGARRGGAKVRTTRPDERAPRSPDLVDRKFTADGPNELWVTDLTYVPTWSGMAYVSFITDVYSRMIVGCGSRRTCAPTWSSTLSRWPAGPAEAVASKGSSVTATPGRKQYTSVRYTERIDEIGARPSIGSVADSYDNALAETINGLYKTELIHRQRPWRTVEDVELATLGWVHWFNNERLHSALGDIPPAEFEEAHYAQPATSELVETK